MANSSKEHLDTLQTPFGKRSVYESVCYCNRCGMCASVCPSYIHIQQEPFSPRGRNQILRQILAGKLKITRERKLLQQIIASCTLCGRCVQNCPGQIPTPEHVLELRRRLKISLLPSTLIYLLRLRQRTPDIFAFVVKGGLILRRTGLLRLVSCLPGFTWIKHALEIIPPAAQISTGASMKGPTLIYLPSLEAEFLMPSLFERTYKLAAQKHSVAVWSNTASGLFEYVYGDIRMARKLVRDLIVRHADVGNGKLPILTDSMDVYNFLMQASQLVANLPTLEKKAADFCACVRYVTDLFEPRLTSKNNFSAPVQLCSSAAFFQHGLAQQKTQKILTTLFGKNFVQCGYKEGTVPPLGCGFVTHTRAPAYSLSAVRAIAAHQTQTVFVLSGLTALELAFYVRRFYPAAHVRHIVELGE